MSEWAEEGGRGGRAPLTIQCIAPAASPPCQQHSPVPQKVSNLECGDSNNRVEHARLMQAVAGSGGTSGGSSNAVANSNVSDSPQCHEPFQGWQVEVLNLPICLNL